MPLFSSLFLRDFVGLRPPTSLPPARNGIVLIPLPQGKCGGKVPPPRGGVSGGGNVGGGFIPLPQGFRRASPSDIPPACGGLCRKASKKRNRASSLRFFATFLRRKRDSNPRYVAVQQFSRLPPSTTRPFLQRDCKGNKKCEKMQGIGAKNVKIHYICRIWLNVPGRCALLHIFCISH